MKKLLAIILASMFLMSVLASCTTDIENETEGNTDADSSTLEATESTTDTEPTETEPTETEPAETEPVEDNGYGTLTLELPSQIYSNYPAVSFTYTFSDESKAEELTFTTDDKRVIVEDGKISAKGAFSLPRNVKVTAKSEHFEATAIVKVSIFDGGLDLETKIGTRQDQIAARSDGDTDGMVIFVGDSFFNPDSWWSSFYNDYAGKKAYTVGISSTTTSDWLILSERLVYPYNPSAVVVHCGTNDIFDDKDSATTTANRLITLFETYHERMPDTTIYWFSIEPRTNLSFADPKAVNETIFSYANGKDWLVCIDSVKWCYESDGTTIKTSFYKDTVHPANASYALYRNALAEAGLVIPNNKTSENTAIADISRVTSQNISNAANPIIYRGKQLVTEYVITGTFTLTDIINNGHAEFQFESYKNRFLIWDKDSDKNLGVGWALLGTTTNETQHEEYVLGSTPLVIEWKLLFTEKNAYLYLDGKLKAVFYNVPNPTHLVLSTEGMTASFTNIKAYTKADDAAVYNAALAEVATYEANAGTSQRVERI